MIPRHICFLARFVFLGPRVIRSRFRIATFARSFEGGGDGVRSGGMGVT